MLLYFKYLLFFTNSFVELFNMLGFKLDYPTLYIILPLGISFYTFQTISYTVDVYRRLAEPEKDILVYSTYVILFPQLVAGPVLRAGEVIHQLKVKQVFNWIQFEYGLKRILYGLFLKVVLADNISVLVDDCFRADPGNLSALDVVTMSFLFGYQIYFDFAGYSHIAIGSSHLLGYHFPENFNFPYLAASLRDFWRRWHISLSSWIRDYLYLPLLGLKVGSSSQGGIGQAIEKPTRSRANLVLFITWAIMGLWHGANWTFVIWGLYHATFIFIERLLKPGMEKFSWPGKDFLGWLLTLFLSMMSWIPFRAESVDDVMVLYSNLFDFGNMIELNFRENTYIIAALILLVMTLAGIYNYRIKQIVNSGRFKFAADIAVYVAAIYFIFIFLRPVNQFIYFQF